MHTKMLLKAKLTSFLRKGNTMYKNCLTPQTLLHTLLLITSFGFFFFFNTPLTFFKTFLLLCNFPIENSSCNKCTQKIQENNAFVGFWQIFHLATYNLLLQNTGNHPDIGALMCQRQKYTTLFNKRLDKQSKYNTFL